MRAMAVTEILVIDVAAFVQVTNTHRKIVHFTAECGHGYVERLNELAAEGVVSDLPHAMADAWEELVEHACAVSGLQTTVDDQKAKKAAPLGTKIFSLAQPRASALSLFKV